MAVIPTKNEFVRTPDGVTIPTSGEFVKVPDGGGEDVYYNRYGAQYTKKMLIPVSNNGAFPRYDYCYLLEEVEVSPTSDAQLADLAPESIFAYCDSLKRAVIKTFKKIGHYFFRNCTALEEVTVGDIGVPVSTLGTLAFAGDTQAGLTITVYVSDDTARPLAGSPWGAINATIIYRSSTTGEVLS